LAKSVFYGTSISFSKIRKTVTAAKSAYKYVRMAFFAKKNPIFSSDISIYKVNLQQKNDSKPSTEFAFKSWIGSSIIAQFRRVVRLLDVRRNYFRKPPRNIFRHDRNGYLCFGRYAFHHRRSDFISAV
jgi:hypothetical protein